MSTAADPSSTGFRPSRAVALGGGHGPDVVVLGPGPWFTRVPPHVLVPESHDASMATHARKVVVLNLVPQPGETAGYSPELYLDVLFEHAPRLPVDAVIADVDSVPAPKRLVEAAEAMGARTYLCHVADRTLRSGPTRPRWPRARAGRCRRPPGAPRTTRTTRT